MESMESMQSEICQDMVKADKFNKYLAKVGEDLAAIIPHVPPTSFHENVKSFSLRQVSENEVLKVLCDVKNKKSIGTDGIHMYILKLLPPVTILIVTWCNALVCIVNWLHWHSWAGRSIQCYFFMLSCK